MVVPDALIVSEGEGEGFWKGAEFSAREDYDMHHEHIFGKHSWIDVKVNRSIPFGARRYVCYSGRSLRVCV